MVSMTQFTDDQLKVMAQEYTLRGKAAVSELERRKGSAKGSKDNPKGGSKGKSKGGDKERTKEPGKSTKESVKDNNTKGEE